MKITIAVSAAALVLLATSVVPAQPAPTDDVQGTDDVNPVVSEVELDVPESSDPAFERYVDLSLLASALQSKDAGTLTDCALQFAHAESLLQRSHKELTAEELLLAAVQLAANDQDEETLARLSKAAARLGNKELEVSLKLSSGSRSLEPSIAMSVDLTATSIEHFAAMKRALEDISEASKANDGEALDGIAKAIAETSLADAQKDSLTSHVEAARKQLADEPEGAGDALSKLTGTSRGGLLGRALRSGLGGSYNFQGGGYNITIGGGQPAAIGSRRTTTSYPPNYQTVTPPGSVVVTSTSRPIARQPVASRPGMAIENVAWYEQKDDTRSGRIYWIARYFGDDKRTYFMQRYDNAGGRLAPTGETKEGRYSYDVGSSQLRMDAGLATQYPPYVLKFSSSGSKLDFDSRGESHTWRNRPPLPLQ